MSSELMTVPLHMRHRSVRRSGFVVEVDPRLPDATVGRTVYHAPNERYVAPPHRHDFPHHLLCLAGTCAVGWTAGRDVTWHDLSAGDAVEIPPDTVHRVWLGAGSVLASVDPATSWLATGGVEQLAADARWLR